MAETSIFDNSWVDMVFEGRNQQYGAFVLRKKSSNYTLKGIIFFNYWFFFSHCSSCN
jgi:periplasmic protein TonB